MEVVSQDKEVLLTGYKSSVCVIGCSWRFRKPDGTTCKGFSVTTPRPGLPFILTAYCKPRTYEENLSLSGGNLMIDTYAPGSVSTATYDGDPVTVRFE